LSLLWSGWSINVTLFVITKFSPHFIKSHGATLRSIIKGNIFICYDFIIFKRLSNPIPGWNWWFHLYFSSSQMLQLSMVPTSKVPKIYIIMSPTSYSASILLSSTVSLAVTFFLNPYPVNEEVVKLKLITHKNVCSVSLYASKLLS